MSDTAELGNYIIKGGAEGRARLSAIARVLSPTTGALFDRFEPLLGRTVVDAGCGGGDVGFELAGRVGRQGRVVCFDLDADKLALARQEAERRGLGHIEFHRCNVLDRWPESSVSIVYARFVLTHLVRPEDMLARALDALAPGGLLVVEDIDFDGHFSDPDCPAFVRYCELYCAAAQRRGVDPRIGRRLVRLLEEAGFRDVESSLVQPYGRTGEVKEVASITFAVIANSVAAAGLATSDEIAAIAADLAAFTERPDTTLSWPRIFQAWGHKA